MKRYSSLAFSLGALAFSSLLACAPEEDAPQPARPSPLRAGAGERPIELPIGHSHAGYAQSWMLGFPHPPDDPKSPYADLFPATRGLESQPYAKAVVLENDTSRLVLAKVDAIFPTRELRERALELLKKRHGYELADVLVLQASHTHGSGGRILFRGAVPELFELEEAAIRPGLVHGLDTFSWTTLERYAEAIAGAVHDALSSSRPARLGVGRQRVEGASRDRRCVDDWLYGPDAIDDTVTVLRLEEADSRKPLAALFHFAVHGTIYSGSSRLLSVDVPGHAERALAELFDSPLISFHLQGTAGDVAPDGGGHVGSQAMQRTGERIARAALAAWEEAETRREVALDVRVDFLEVSHERIGYQEGEFYEAGALQCAVGDGTCSERAYPPEEVSCFSAIVPGTENPETTLTVALIDDLALFTLPGEPVSAASRVLKEEAQKLGFTDALVLGYAQEHDGYLMVDEEDWLSGGYEPSITFWGWRYGRFLVESSVPLLDALARGERQGRPSSETLSWPERKETAPTLSSTPPGVELDVPEVVERLETLRFAFSGGDPGLGTPVVTLQREGADGAFAPVTTNGWLPVDNRRAGALVTFYSASPTSRAAPDASEREHRFEVLYEPPRDLPEGRYRFHVEGVARGESGDEPFRFASRVFTLVPSRALLVEAAASEEGGSTKVAATLRYPAKAAELAGSPGNEGHQVGSFLLIDARFRPPFVPVVEGGQALAPAQLEDEGEVQEIALAFEELSLEEVPYEPGKGPGFRATLPSTPSEGALLRIEAGTLKDAWGNTHGEPLELTVR